MEQRHKDKLRTMRVSLVQNVDAEHLTDHLYAKNILVREDIEVIKSKVTSADKMRTLVDILPTRGPSTFNVFIEALRQHDNIYSWLIEQLTQP